MSSDWSSITWPSEATVEPISGTSQARSNHGGGQELEPAALGLDVVDPRAPVREWRVRDCVNCTGAIVVDDVDRGVRVTGDVVLAVGARSERDVRWDRLIGGAFLTVGVRRGCHTTVHMACSLLSYIAQYR